MLILCAAELCSLGAAPNLIDALFGARLRTEMKCQEADGEPVKVKMETVHKLQCNIRGTEQTGADKVDHMYQGINMARCMQSPNSPQPPTP